MFIKKTNLQFDLGRLQQDYAFVHQSLPFYQDKQIGLTSSVGSEEPLFEAAGRMYSDDGKTQIKWQHKFTEFNPQFAATYFAEVYQTVCRWSPYKIGRVRLMHMPPHYCYTIHKDHQIRYHLVIKTNPNSYFLIRPKTENYYAEFNEETGEVDGFRAFHIPANGYLYEFDARQPHTFLNAFQEDRVHLVLETYTGNE